MVIAMPKKQNKPHILLLFFKKNLLCSVYQLITNIEFSSLGKENDRLAFLKTVTGM